MAPQRSVGRGVLLLLASTAVYGSTPSLFVSLQGDFDFLTLLALRGLIAALTLGALSRISATRFRGKLGRNETDSIVHDDAPGWDSRAFLMGMLLYGPDMALYYASFQHLDTSVAVALAFMYPTVVVLLASAARRRRPPIRDLALGILALVGVTALSLPGSSAGVTTTGVVMVIVSSIGYALYVTLASRLSTELPPLRVAAEMMAGSALSTVVIACVLGSFAPPTMPDAWLALVAQGLLLVVGTVAYFGGLVVLGATRASLIDSAQPLVAAVVGAMLLGERLLPVQVLGIWIILVSVVGAVLSARR